MEAADTSATSARVSTLVNPRKCLAFMGVSVFNESRVLSQRRKSSMKTHLKTRHGVHLTHTQMEVLLDSLQIVRSPSPEPAETPNYRSDGEGPHTPASLPHHLSSSPAPSYGSPLTQYSEPSADGNSFPAVHIHEADMGESLVLSASFILFD